MSDFKVGDKVVYSFEFSLTTQYYGTIVSINVEEKTCAVEYDTGKERWVDEKEPFHRLRKLTKLERALR